MSEFEDIIAAGLRDEPRAPDAAFVAVVSADIEAAAKRRRWMLVAVSIVAFALLAGLAVGLGLAAPVIAAAFTGWTLGPVQILGPLAGIAPAVGMVAALALLLPAAVMRR